MSAGFEEVRQRGDYSEAVVYARQAAGLVWDLPSAKELVKRLSKEADEHLRERRITLLGDA